MAGNPLDLKSRDSTVKDDDDVAPTKNRVADPGQPRQMLGLWCTDDTDTSMERRRRWC